MKNQNKIVFFIGIIVLITIAVQLYWNYIQYKINRQQVENEIQIALDNAVDNYYTELSKKTVFGTYYQYEDDSVHHQLNILENNELSAFSINNGDLHSINPKDIKSIDVKQDFEIKSISIQEDTVVIGRPKLDSRLDEISRKIQQTSLKSIGQIDSTDGIKRRIKAISFHQGQKAIDSLERLNEAVMKIVVSVEFDSIQFDSLKVKINQELNRKNIYFDYFLVQKNKLKLSIDSVGVSDSAKFPFVAVSNTALLPNYSTLEMHYPNIFWITLKKGITGILLSFILSAAIVFSLFYLLRIIKKQKQLSEIKNDFISNITHELKTPIATVTSAVEGLQNFNADNNPEKTKKYLDISAQQLIKLKILVEKIMETSVVESKELILEKETTDVISLLKTCIEKNKLNTSKEIEFLSNAPAFMLNIDVFHFENAISNLIENAIKYGGDSIKIQINVSKEETIIAISDNGDGIPQLHKKLIFDKFYRIPTHNKHNVKGFGIGLYYAKNIIEKHNGTIELKSNNPTTFLIRL